MVGPWVLARLLAGCSDYELVKEGGPVDPIDEGDGAPAQEAPPAPEPDGLAPEGTGAIPDEAEGEEEGEPEAPEPDGGTPEPEDTAALEDELPPETPAGEEEEAEATPSGEETPSDEGTPSGEATPTEEGPAPPEPEDDPTEEPPVASEETPEDEPAAETPPEEPVADEPAAENPVDEPDAEPSADEPAAEEEPPVTAEEPAAEDPAAEEEEVIVLEEDPAPDLNCTATQGYWQNHPEAWPVAALTLGGRTYDAAELVAIFEQSVSGDASVNLAHQLIAARLSAAGGADTSAIAETLQLADAWLTDHDDDDGLPFTVPSGSSAGREAVDLAAILAEYNEGTIGPGHCS